MNNNATGTGAAHRTSPILAKPATNYRYTVVMLLGGMTCINYVDRYNIAAAVPTLMKLFGLSPSKMGVLMSAFGWSYLVCMAMIGYLLNRKSPKTVAFWCCLGWGLVTTCTSLVAGFYSFLVVRVLLGATESAAFPACARVVGVWTPKRERTFSTGVFDCASKFGSAFSPPLVVWAIINWGWKSSFLITGCLAIIYAFVWLRFYHDPEKHPRISQSELDYIRQDQVLDDQRQAIKTPEIPMYKLLTYPRIFLMCTGFFLYMYHSTVFHVWIPAYLVHAKGYNLKQMGYAAAYPYIGAVVFELIGSFTLDKWFQHGATLNQVRRTGQFVGMFGSAIALYLAVVAPTPGMTVFWLTASYSLVAISGAQNWAITTNLAPQGQIGTVSAMNGMCGALATIVAPVISGLLIETRWGYDGALVVTVVAVGLAGLIYGTLDYSKPIVPRVKKTA
jgi:ACS family glucarate transporter-like MFS transporter